MNKVLIILVFIALTGCATQSTQVTTVEPSVSEQVQRAAQKQLQEASKKDKLSLKRRIAVGRLSNETNYGRSLLRENSEDKLGRKVTDMFLQALTNSESFLVFERPDIELLRNEALMTGLEINIVGVDTLVVGSLTQFGRATLGERGFLSSSKIQEATATVDIRLVEVKTGRVFDAVTGTGKSSTEHARTMGFGSAAGYDGSLNDQAIGAAVAAAVDKMTRIFMEKPWTADILGVQNEKLFISGGKSQGVSPGMIFDVVSRGETVKSRSTGAMITLPGEKVADLEVVSMFGDDIMDEGAIAKIISGSISGLDFNELVVKERKK